MPASPRVLIVDDDVAWAEGLAALLELEGFGATVAADGRQALAVLRRDPDFDVILLDIMMPDIDGMRLRMYQRQDPRLAAIPVVLVSGAGELPERAARLGVERCLMKPVEPETIVDVLRQLCRTSTSPRASRPPSHA